MSRQPNWVSHKLVIHISRDLKTLPSAISNAGSDFRIAADPDSSILRFRRPDNSQSLAGPQIRNIAMRP